MAVVDVGGQTHVYAPNAKLHGEVWSEEYPKLSGRAPYLRNKFTGEIVPNLEAMRHRSDVLEEYWGELPEDGGSPTNTGIEFGDDSAATGLITSAASSDELDEL